MRTSSISVTSLRRRDVPRASTDLSLILGFAVPLADVVLRPSRLSTWSVCAERRCAIGCGGAGVLPTTLAPVVVDLAVPPDSDPDVQADKESAATHGATIPIRKILTHGLCPEAMEWSRLCGGGMVCVRLKPAHCSICWAVHGEDAR